MSASSSGAGSSRARSRKEERGGSPAIVTAADAADFLALLPQIAGYTPRDSVLLVAFCGNRTAGAMRFDLPKTRNPTALKRISTTLVGMLCRLPGVDAVVPVVYCDAAFGAGATPPFDDFAAALVRRAEQSGFLVRDVLCVAADGWGGYRDTERPEGGRPLSEIAESRVLDAVPSELRRGEDALREGRELPNASLVERERVGSAVARLKRGLVSNCLGSPPDPLDPESRLVLGGEGFLRRGAEGLSVDDAACLLLVLDNSWARTAFLLGWAFGPEYTVPLVEGRLAPTVAPGHDVIELLRGVGPRPDVERVAAAIALLKRAVAVAPRELGPAPLTMIAWLYWALGLGSVAGHFLERALRVDQQDGFARLLDSMLRAGLLPEWAFHPQ